MAEKIKIKTVEDGVDGAPPWITTFVDMTSLLVTFFILLFTFSSIQDHEEFTIPRNLLGTAGVMEDKPARDMSAPNDDIMSSYDLQRGAGVPHARPLDELADNIEEMGQALDEEHLEVDLNRVVDGLRIRFDDAASFAPGQAVVKEALRRSLLEAADTLSHYPHLIVLEGFVDDAFRPTSAHPTAESLALARAEAAAEVLTSTGKLPAARVLISGIGARSRPDATENSATARARNRRVELLVQPVSTTMARQLEARR